MELTLLQVLSVCPEGTEPGLTFTARAGLAPAPRCSARHSGISNQVIAGIAGVHYRHSSGKKRFALAVVVSIGDLRRHRARPDCEKEMGNLTQRENTEQGEGSQSDAALDGLKPGLTPCSCPQRAPARQGSPGEAAAPALTPLAHEHRRVPGAPGLAPSLVGVLRCITRVTVEVDRLSSSVGALRVVDLPILHLGCLTADRCGSSDSILQTSLHGPEPAHTEPPLSSLP